MDRGVVEEKHLVPVVRVQGIVLVWKLRKGKYCGFV